MRKSKIPFIVAKLKVLKERICNSEDSNSLLDYIDEILQICEANHLED